MNASFRTDRFRLRSALMSCCGLVLLVCGFCPQVAAAAESAADAESAAPLPAVTPQLLQCRLLRSEAGYTLSLFYVEEGENLCFRVDLFLESLAAFPQRSSVVLLNPCRECLVREWVLPQLDAPVVLREVETRTQDADSARLTLSACGAEGQALRRLHEASSLPAPHRVAVDAAATGGETLELRFTLGLEVSTRCESSTTDVTPRPGRPPLESTSEVQGMQLLVARFRWDEAIALCPE